MSNTTSAGYGPLTEFDITSLQMSIVSTGVDFFFWGLYTALVGLSSYMMLTHNGRLQTSRARKLLLTTILTMFFACTAETVMILTFYVIVFPQYGPAPPDVDSLLFRLKLGINCLTRFNYLISDAIVVWRAWVLWPYNLKVRVFLAFCLLGTAGAVFVDGGLLIADLVTGGASIQPYGPRTLILTLPLLVTNAVATLTIALRAWIHRKEVKQSFSMISAKSKVDKILILLVESGAVYCLLWVFYLVIGFQVINNIGYQAVVSAFPVITAMYPTVIVLFVTTDRSECDKVLSDIVTRSIHFNSKLNTAQRQASTNTTSMPSPASPPEKSELQVFNEVNITDGFLITSGSFAPDLEGLTESSSNL